VREIKPYAVPLTTAISIAVGDVMGDAQPELLVGAPSGMAPEVKIYSIEGKLLKTLPVFVPQFRGGVSVAVGQLTSDAKQSIVVGAGPGGGAYVMAFTAAGERICGFFVDDKAVRTGVRVSAADINNDGEAEIIASSGSGATGWVRGWSRQGVKVFDIPVYSSIYVGGVHAFYISK
jgi:hypothetical protein